MFENRLSIAQVSATCGAGCGQIGVTGIELEDQYFMILYDQVRINKQFDQVPFYELGRNFWFYQEQLGNIDSFLTGFAILNRFLSMDYAQVRGAPFWEGLDFNAFKQSILIDLLKVYMSDTHFNWRNTLAVGAAPQNPNNWGGADLAAAMLFVIYRNGGPLAMRKYWHTMGTLPAARTQEQAIGNFLHAANVATGKDFRCLIRDYSFTSSGASACDILDTK